MAFTDHATVVVAEVVMASVYDTVWVEFTLSGKDSAFNFENSVSTQ